MDFLPGSYAQIKIPAFDCIDYDKDFDKSLIGDEYLPSWEKFGLFPQRDIFIIAHDQRITCIKEA